MTTTEAKHTPTIEGWNGCLITQGDLVRVRRSGFGNHCVARILKLEAGPLRECEIELVKVGKTSAGRKAGNRYSINAAWLEALK